MTGQGINDRILFRFREGHEQPLTLSGGGESFTFADRAFVRVGHERVEVSGDLRRLRLTVTGRPQLVPNGKPVASRVADGLMACGD